METINNPFLEGQPNEKSEVRYIFDNSLNRTNEQKHVFKFLIYMKLHKDEMIYDMLKDLIIGHIGEQSFDLIEKCYIDTYNPTTKVFARYSYLESKQQCGDIINSFNVIFSLMGDINQLIRDY